MHIQPILATIVESYLNCPQHALTLGQFKLLKRYLELDSKEQSDYQRLYLRSSPLQRRDKLSIDNESFSKLRNCGLIINSNPAPGSKLEKYTKKELVDLCLSNNLVVQRKFKKHELIEVLLSLGEELKDDTVQFVWIAHSRTFLGICRWYVCHHDGDVTRIIVKDLGHRVYIGKNLPSKKASFPNRLHKILYEEFLYGSPRYTTQRPEIKYLKEKHRILMTIEPLIEKSYFSPLRRFYRMIHHWVNETLKDDIDMALYLLQWVPEKYQNYSLIKKVAVKCHQSERSEQGLRHIEGVLPFVLKFEAYSLLQTYNSMAFRLKRPRKVFPYLRIPDDREITLNLSERQSTRPLFEVNGRILNVENAVCEALKSEGHKAIFAEGQFWTGIIILLFWEAYSDISLNQIPSPVLSAPLDFRTREFYERRKDFINSRLSEIEKGLASDILSTKEDVYNSFLLQHISKNIRFDDYELVCNLFNGKTLSELLGFIIIDNRQYTGGMPDLIVIPNTERIFSRAFPNRFRTNCLFAELKTPNDQLSTSQKIWFDTFKNLNIESEIWNVAYNS